ncbi:MAG TPA: regulatory iron-sulfur-containing complex subunit RicT [Saprospiraceae bacterium]|nr:regulatory iron-sulfur-containing complex subunit RicT [Saprospiraceae bacterium]
MGCSSCGSGTNGAPSGCGDKGHCTSGSCNKLNTYDWIATRDMFDPSEYNIVEVSFKKGAHKDFFINDPSTRTITGDMVVVETASGYDVGRISLSGELVRMQMKKKFTSEDRVAFKVIRKANDRDLEKLEEARQLEQETMVRARVISRTLGLDMKIGDIEYQGDKKKATFYYTAEGRVDFRELVKEYAREFKVKIEMRQIGARQESARIGGIGSCGRELCCSTWLSDFKSVNTAAARYQNIAINQTKLSGQCGRLKCCLNYELDTYMDALDDFPEDADILKVKAGTAHLVKTDIFKGILYYVVDNEKMRGQFIPVDKSRAKEIKELNRKGVIPNELNLEKAVVVPDRDSEDVDIEHGYEDVTGQIELRNEPRNKKKKKPQQKSGDRNQQDRRGPSGQSNERGPRPEGQPKTDGQPRNQGQQRPQGQPKGDGQNKNEGQNRPEGQNQQRPPRPNPQGQQNQNPRPPRPERNPNEGPKENRPLNPNQRPNNQAGSNRNQEPKPDTNQNNAGPNQPPVNPTPNADGTPNANANKNKKKKFFNKNRKPKDGQ